MAKLTVGQQAPAFSLHNQDGKPIQLSDYLGSKHVVLYFYPKDETPGCTKEACSFRDRYEDFLEAGAEVIGVSADSVASHQRFATGRKLPFQLLSDPGSKVAKQYGVNGLFGLLPGRETFVINQEGIIISKFSSQLQIDPHISKALDILKQQA